MFGDFGQAVSTGSKKVHGLQSEQVETLHIGEERPVAAIATDQTARCGECGSRKHGTQACQVDLSKTKCFRCNQFGHVGMNCKNKTNDGNNWKSTVVKSDV